MPTATILPFLPNRPRAQRNVQEPVEPRGDEPPVFAKLRRLAKVSPRYVASIEMLVDHILATAANTQR